MSAERIVASRYRLRSRLGSGGMGTVWLAFDEVLHREVAIKEIVVSSVLESAAQIGRRAMAEARVAARLDHRNIVTVHDVLSEADTIWIVMTLVRGRSLQEAVQADGPMTPAAAAGLGLGLLDALDAAHAIGIVHRDVKPSNIMLPDSGGVMLTDFSIVAAADSAGLTQTGVVLGTPGYVAPERMTQGRADAAADLFGLGATLYFAVEGRGPFDRETPLAAVLATVNEPHPPPERAGALRTVLDGLLAKDPAKRWSSERTRAALNISEPMRLGRTVRIVAYTVGLALAIGLIGSGVYALSRDHPVGSPQASHSSTATATPTAGPNASPAAAPTSVPVVLAPVKISTPRYNLNFGSLSYWEPGRGRWHTFEGGVRNSNAETTGMRRLEHLYNTKMSDSQAVGAPLVQEIGPPAIQVPMAVLRFGGRYYLYFLVAADEQAPTGSLYLATSADLLRWQVQGPVFQAPVERRGFAVLSAGSQWVAYTATATGIEMRTSIDLIRWSPPRPAVPTWPGLCGGITMGRVNFLCVRDGAATSLLRSADARKFAGADIIPVTVPALASGYDAEVAQILLGPSEQPYLKGRSGWVAALTGLN